MKLIQEQREIFCVAQGVMRECDKVQRGSRHSFLISFCLQNRIIRGLVTPYNVSINYQC